MGRWTIRHGDGYIETLIIYGLVKNPNAIAKKLLSIRDGTISELSHQHSFLTPKSSALRLNSEGWLQHSSDTIEINNSTLLYDLTIEKVMRNIPPFSQSTSVFIKSYFYFMLEQTKKISINEEKSEIFGQKDWIYSAWLPMPNTHILLSPEFNNQKINFVEFDLSFWTGEQLICIQLGQSNTLIKSKRKKREQLEFAHPQIKIIKIPNKYFTGNNMPFPSDLFSKNFCHFWQGLRLPLGPNMHPILKLSP